MRNWKISPEILIASGLPLAQIILAFSVFRLSGIPALEWAGWLMWAISALFAFWPIYTLRVKGHPPKGKSYTQTTKLVDSELYAVCRHPQYTAGALFNISLSLISQHWLVILMGLISGVLISLNIQRADREGLDKFGVRYQRYMNRVPRANYLLGIWRLIKADRSQRA